MIQAETPQSVVIHSTNSFIETMVVMRSAQLGYYAFWSMTTVDSRRIFDRHETDMKVNTPREFHKRGHR